MQNPQVSILLRTRDAGPHFTEVLDAIESQSETGRELVVVDSGSKDGTREQAAARGARIVDLEPERFTHARSTNLGFEASRGELVVSLSQDATPTDSRWLHRLMEKMTDPDVAAAFGRQLPRPGCFAVEQMELARAYPASPDVVGRVPFSNVNSIVRRDLWRQHRFDESLTIAEDQEWAGWAVSSGFRVDYLPEATVWHSHNYTLKQFYNRCFGEGRALAEFSQFRPGLRTVLIGWPRQVASDLKMLVATGQKRDFPRVCAFRLAQLVGSYRGSRS